MAQETRKFTAEQLVDALRDVVSRRPLDYVYTDEEGFTADGTVVCRYVHGEGPGRTAGCGIGAALHHLGVPLEELSRREGLPAAALEEYWANHKAGIVATAFQRAQDGGATWSAAFDVAMYLHGTLPEALGPA